MTFSNSAFSKHNTAQERLSIAYRVLAHLKLDDHTYTHLSARTEKGFLLPTFGYRFEEITPDRLKECILTDGTPASDLNVTGYMLHSAFYRNRNDIHAVFHVHTPEMIAVSSMQEGLLPLSQWALHFYNQIHYHDYASLALEKEQGETLSHIQKPVIMLRNHGVIVAAPTIHAALWYTYHLQKACETQCLALSMNRSLVMPMPSICEKAHNELMAFEKDLGKRDWEAWIRKMENSPD